MATKKKKKSANLTDELKESANKIWLAGLGALSMAESEGSKLFSTLVEKGRALDVETTTDALKARATKLSKSARKGADVTLDSVEKSVEATVSKTLGRLGIPSKDQVRELSAQVRALSKRLDEVGAGGKTTRRKTAKKKKKKVTRKAAKKSKTRGRSTGARKKKK